MMTFALYFVLGFLFKAFVDGMKATSAAMKIKKNNEQKYKQVLRRIRKGKSTFKTRVNNTVYNNTSLHETGEVDVILFLDTKKVAFQSLPVESRQTLRTGTKRANDRGTHPSRKAARAKESRARQPKAAAVR